MSTAADRPLALVTGASSGIGLELAKQFANNGYDLINAAQDDELQTAEQELQANGAQLDPVQVDLASEGGVHELYRHVAATSRPLAAAARNAGRGAGGALANTSWTTRPCA
jgi:short-subunit dehydrogenase